MRKEPERLRYICLGSPSPPAWLPPLPQDQSSKYSIQCIHRKKPTLAAPKNTTSFPSKSLHIKESASSVGMLRERVSAFVAERDVTVPEIADNLVSKELKVRERLRLPESASSGRKLFPSQ